MACLVPVKCYWSKKVNPSGLRSLVTDIRKALDDRIIIRPCGQCINCRIADASDKTVRMVHESKSHECNSFLTLTYKDNPESLCHRDFQLFMKRLRKVTPFKFKYYMCGEYGEKLLRPHYHVALFGCDFNDRVFYKTNKNGHDLHTSKLLDEVWGHGICSIGDITTASARYVAGYVVKKITGDPKEWYYSGRVPEYGRGSNGLGLEYLRKFGSQWMNQGFVVLDGSKYRIPRYYDIKYKEIDPHHFDQVKDARAVDRPIDPNVDGTYNRFVTVDTVVKARLSQKGRTYED